MNKEHPRLFFSREDLPAIRASLQKSPLAGRWDKFLRVADFLSSLTVKELLEGYKDTRRISGYAGICAFAYAMTEEKRYGSAAVALGLAAAGRSKAYWQNDRETPFPYNKGAALLTAHLSLACALVYDWCYDALRQEERDALRAALVDKGFSLYLESVTGAKRGFTDEGTLNLQDPERRDWWVDNLTSNWGGVIHGGLGTAALAILDEEDSAAEVAEYARHYVPRFIRQAISEDGGSDEGIMYAQYGIVWSVYFLLAAIRNRGLDPAVLEELNGKLAGYWLVYMQGTDGRYANFNNMREDTFQGMWAERLSMYDSLEQIEAVLARGGADFEGGPNAALAALFEALVPGGDSLLLWAADNSGAGVEWLGISPFYFLWRRPDAPMQQEKPALQQSVLFRGNGHIVAQSDTLWLAYNGGRISGESHRNFDLGTFVLKVNGEGLISDPGYGRLETHQHSTVMVDGLGQKSGGAAHYTKYAAAEEYTYFASDLTASYISGNVKRVERHFIIPRGRYVLIMDHIEGDEALNVELRLQTAKDIRSLGGKAIIAGERQWLAVAASGNQQVSLGQGVSGPGSIAGDIFRFVRVNPLEDQRHCLLATLLFPVSPGEPLPDLLFDPDGTVEIIHKGRDRISFGREQGGGLAVRQINGAIVPDESMHGRRSILPLRGLDRKGLAVQELNPWMLGQQTRG
jgi:hypothetical protein